MESATGIDEEMLNQGQWRSLSAESREAKGPRRQKLIIKRTPARYRGSKSKTVGHLSTRLRSRNLFRAEDSRRCHRTN